MLRKLWHFLGALPAVTIGAGLFLLGLLTLRHLVNNLWVIDVNRLDLVRAVALDQAEAPALLEAAYPEVIVGFLAAVSLTAIGLALPFIYYLNKRFWPQRMGAMLVLRQSIWAGMWAAACFWLQINRALSIPVALLVLVVFILFELLLQVRQQSAVPPNLPPPTPIKPNG